MWKIALVRGANGGEQEISGAANGFVLENGDSRERPAPARLRMRRHSMGTSPK